MSKECAYHSDPEILGGTLVFKGTRAPVQSLFAHLKPAIPSRIKIKTRAARFLILHFIRAQSVATLLADEISFRPHRLRRVHGGRC